jgi:hypothetical protein
MLGATSVCNNKRLRDFRACIAALLAARDRVEQHAMVWPICDIVETSIYDYGYTIRE